MTEKATPKETQQERERVLRLLDWILDWDNNIDLCVGEAWVKNLRQAVAEGKETVERAD